ncbi:dihydropteroate synthase [Xinfangfangia sp. D13-10-4-6]|uniref:dihydropteroate synthase n=1 Tax=Pseudogemmobacter hezensis TaxID=2737662 RepID=UPI001553FBCA|nr:dihydropteroate synthase [Pseudogemmobacter hezensis]NPD16224.1 dihydropteroate synthase [Pseudogemmobacter hezensis]
MSFSLPDPDQILQPLPRSGASAAQTAPRRSLGGSRHLWWNEARLSGRDGTAAEVRDDAHHGAGFARISAARADLVGLSLNQPRIMGILNVTPDSFSDGGRHNLPEAALARAQEMLRDAEILDIGGESTRPGAAEVPVAEEIARTAPVIAALRAAGITAPISIDTRKAAVAEAALQAGANIINDVSAMRFDPDMAALAAQSGAPIVLMHSVATPETMQKHAHYDDVLWAVRDHLFQRVEAALSAGIRPENLILDPGIGFGKTTAHDLQLLRDLGSFHEFGLPLLLGASRKKFIGAITGAATASERVSGSVAVALQGAASGVQILRVHDTRETRQALSIWQAIQGNYHEE